MWPKGDSIDRGLNRASRFPQQDIVPNKFGEGAIDHEIFGSGVAATERGGLGPMLQTLLGSVLTNAAGTVNDATATDTEFDSDLVLVVGQLVRVDIGGTFEVRRITAVVGGPTYTYTVQRAFSAAPVDTAVISASVTYLHLGTESEKFMTFIEYIKTVKHSFVDAVCEKMDFGVTENDTIKGNFAIRAITHTKATGSADPNTPTYSTDLPHVGTECNLITDGSALNMKEFNFSLATRRARGGINSTGISDLPWMDMFDATGNITPWVEDFSQFDDFFASTLGDIEMTQKQGVNILHVELQDIQYTGPEVGDDEGDFQWSLPFKITGGVYVGMFYEAA